MRAFTLLELLVVAVLIMVLAAILLPALSKARTRAQAIFSLSNQGSLTKAWLMYADDNSDRLAYNLGGSTPRPGLANSGKATYNWVNNVMTWELDSDNTNTATILEASLGPYAGSPAIYRCPSDLVLSPIQQRAGWHHRIRSYSMNAMIGDAGELSQKGFNVNNPKYVQFFSLQSVPDPSEIFLFIEEHPDSINDGYFLNRDYTKEWIDLPAAHHNGAAAMSFVDGHTELHRWVNPTTLRPERPGAAALPFSPPRTELTDYNWVVNHMSVHRE